MLDKPNPNSTEPKREIPPTPEPRVGSPGASVGGDHIIIQGNVGPGASVGSGSVNADYIVQGDLTINNNGAVANTPERFAEMLGELHAMLEQAREKGELDPALAREALENVEAATTLIKTEKKPPKPELIKKLEAVAKMIDAAVEMLTGDGVGSILVKALPIAVALIKLATHLF